MSLHFRQAITTTSHLHAGNLSHYVRTRAQAGSMRHPWNDALTADQNHAEAAKAYAEKLGWPGTWYGGGLPDGVTRVFVCRDLADPVEERAFTVANRWAE